jgi:putrescine transport system ATP-binding protein
MMAGEVVDNHSYSGYVVVKSPETNTEIKVRTKERLELNQEVWVAVRPEEMGISSLPAPPNENQVEGRIMDIAFLGDLVIYHVVIEETEKILHVSVPTSTRSKSADLVIGGNAFVSWYDSDGVVLVE